MSRSVLVAVLVIVAVCSTHSTSVHRQKRDVSDLFHKISELIEKITKKIRDDLKALTEKLGALGKRIRDAAELLTSKLKELKDKGASALPGLRDDILKGVDDLLQTVKEARENPDLFLVEKIQLDLIITWLKAIEGVLHLIPGATTTESAEIPY